MRLFDPFPQNFTFSSLISLWKRKKNSCVANIILFYFILFSLVLIKILISESRQKYPIAGLDKLHNETDIHVRKTICDDRKKILLPLVPTYIISQVYFVLVFFEWNKKNRNIKKNKSDVGCCSCLYHKECNFISINIK